MPCSGNNRCYCVKKGVDVNQLLFWCTPHTIYSWYFEFKNQLASGEKVVDRKYGNKEKSRNFINYYKQVKIMFWE